mgnify:CR=1 FL=1
MPASPKAMDLILTHRSELISYARRIVGNSATAEDVVQEAYLKYWAHTGGTDSTAEQVSEPVGYLYRIVRNLAFDWHRRPARTLTSTVSSNIPLSSSKNSMGCHSMPRNVLVSAPSIAPLIMVLGSSRERYRIGKNNRVSNRTRT